MLPNKSGFKLNPFLCALLPLTMHGIAVAAPTSLPTGGQVVGGDAAATITTYDGDGGAGFVRIDQAKPNVLINWSTFDIAPGNTVQFEQPNASSVAVNRVTSPDASFLDGALNANGRVFVINPNGVLFGQNSVVNVGSLLATTFDISDEDFDAGRFVFRDTGNQGPDAGVVSNAGVITVGVDGRDPYCCIIYNETDGNEIDGGIRDGDGDSGDFVTADIESTPAGFAILAGRNVVNLDNSGYDRPQYSISASNTPNGQIVLASGSALEVSFDDSGLISYAVTPGMVDALNDRIEAGVINNGRLIADGGTITLIARASEDVPGFGILNTGIIQANGIDDDGNGGIYLTATGGTITNRSGTLDASGAGRDDDSGNESYAPQSVRIESDRAVLVGVDDDVEGGGPGTILATGASANAAGSSSSGTVSIQGSEVVLSGAYIDATDDVRVVATAGDISGLLNQSGGDSSNTPNTVYGASLDFQATGSVELGGSYHAGTTDGFGVLATPNADGSSSPGTIFIRGAGVVFDEAFIDGEGEVRIVATAGDVADFSDVGGQGGESGFLNLISGGALGIQAAGSIRLGGSTLQVGTGETLIGGDPSVGDRPGLIAQLHALFPPQQQSVALSSPRADGIEFDEVPDDSSGPAPLYIPDHERPNASFVSGENGSIQLGGQGGSLYMAGDYLYLQTNVYSFQLSEPALSISEFQTASFSSFPLFMQYVPASPGGSVGFEQDLGQTADLNLSPASFSDFPGATLVFGSTANPGDVVIGDDGSVSEGTNGFNYVLAAGPGGLIYNPDGIETDGEVIVLGRVATNGPQPPIDPPRVPDVLYPSPLPPGQTAEFIAARSEPVSNGAPDVTFDLAAALDSTIQYKSAAGPVLSCQ